MSALDSPAVAPGVAARRADRRLTGAYEGRELTTRELDTIRDLELTNAYGARTTGDLDSYVSSLLGIGRNSMQQEIEAREWALACDPFDGCYDREIAERRAAVRRAGELW